MKKLLLSLSVTAALAGCGGSDTLEDIKKESAVVVPKSTVKFDPSNGVVSVPNDLLFSGTTDGTLNLPDEADDYVNPQFVLGALDGWSTQMPYKVDFAFPTGVSLDETSAQTPGAVRIFEVVMGANPTSQTCAQVPAGIACEYVGELAFGTDFITKASGNAVAVVPLKPFKAGTSYITVLTTALQDSEGRAIAPSSTYGLVKQEAPLVTDSQKQLQGVINSYENVITAGSDLNKTDIIYSAAMTTQSAGVVLGTIKKLLAASLQQPNLPTPKVTIPDQPTITVANVLAMGGMQNVPAIFNSVVYQKGSIVLPMYLKTPEGKELSALNNIYWQANCDSAVTVLGYKAKVGALPDSAVSENDGLCMALSGGKLRDLGLDSKRHLTKYNSIPKVQSYANTPVQITKPSDDLTVINMVRAQLNLPALAMPEGGWPVVILQHGITSKKEDMLGLTAALTLQGFATVAIDHPAHGERGVDVDGDGTDEFNATTGSVLAYMNLGSLLVARDNLRQSSADLLALRLGLNFSGDTSLNTQDVSYVGHSLGSIVAPAFLAATNAPVAPQVDPLFKVNTVALSSGGGGIASFLVASDTFGPFVQGSVLLKAGTAESQAFGAYLQGDALASCGALAANQTAYVSCAYGSFMQGLSAAGETQQLANIQGVIAQFTYAAQTALDSGDPTNYAAAVKALGTPVYTSVIVGNNEGNKPDTVIPPTVASNPISGTLPLSNLMGLEVASQTVQSAEPASYVVKFSQGHHGTLLTPAPNPSAGATAAGSAAANTEMQSEVASFLVSKGRMLLIKDQNVIAE